MSGAAKGVGGGVVGEVGYGGYRLPFSFTAVQRQELEHQTMIYKYMVAGISIPTDLVMPIQRSFEAISARLFNNTSLSYSSYYGKKMDPEPGRCRRTDGKKWRCSKDAHQESKYCERHMRRGKNRSRKHVESKSNSNSGSFQGSEIGGFQNTPLSYTEGLSFSSNLTKQQIEPVSYGIDNQELRYIPGPNPDAGVHSFSVETSRSFGNPGLVSSSDRSTWRQISFSEQKSDQHFLSDSSTYPFFNEWPTTKESWSNTSDNGVGKNVFSSTHLSISTPREPSDFSSRSAYDPNEGS